MIQLRFFGFGIVRLRIDTATIFRLRIIGFGFVRLRIDTVYFFEYGFIRNAYLEFAAPVKQQPRLLPDNPQELARTLLPTLRFERLRNIRRYRLRRNP